MSWWGRAITLETFRQKERRDTFLHRRCNGSPRNRSKGYRKCPKKTVSHLPFPIKKKKTHAFSSKRTKNSRINIDAAMRKSKQTGRDKTASSLQNTCKVGAKMSYAYVIYMQKSPLTGPRLPSLLLLLPQSPLKCSNFIWSVTYQGQVCLRSRLKLS